VTRERVRGRQRSEHQDALLRRLANGEHVNDQAALAALLQTRSLPLYAAFGQVHA
jgi:hypothetical protein